MSILTLVDAQRSGLIINMTAFTFNYHLNVCGVLKMKFVAILLVVSLASIHGFIFDSEPEWNGLKAGFGINPFSSTTFASLPRTVTEAVNNGWVRDTTVACGKSGPFAGNRYVKDKDPAAMLLFDKNGFIAGIQAGIPRNSDPKKYPNPNNKLNKAFNDDGTWMVTTAYFVEPADICTKGRTKGDFEEFGTGNMLAIQTGTSPSSLMRIAMEEKDVLTGTKWVAGKCFYTMGMHYWYNLSADMSCDTTFPVFLLYNKGKLNGFGWAFNPNYDNSPRWEHPTKAQYPMFMQTPPKCLGNPDPVSTLHIYLTDSPRWNLC